MYPQATSPLPRKPAVLCGRGTRGPDGLDLGEHPDMMSDSEGGHGKAYVVIEVAGILSLFSSKQTIFQLGRVSLVSSARKHKVYSVSTAEQAKCRLLVSKENWN